MFFSHINVSLSLKSVKTYPQVRIFFFLIKGSPKDPWLVWLGGLSAGLRTKRSLVRFPVRAHAWVAGQVPSWECARAS